MIDYAPSPTAYARHLATYISDPSTIRARTASYFGRAPTLQICARFRADVESRHEREARKMRSSDWSDVEFHCDHPKQEANAVRLACGRVVCRTCREAVRPPKLSTPPPPIKLRPMPPSRLEVLTSVTVAFGITMDDLLGTSRVMHRVNARRVAAKLLRDREMSLNGIGKVMHRDHNTIKNLIDTYDCNAPRFPEMVRAYEMLR